MQIQAATRIPHTMIHHQPVSRRSRAGGFTLAEIIVVITIMMILVTLAASSMGGMMDTLRMKEGIATTRNAMEEARQLAIASNRDVVFRFYRLQDLDGNQAWRGFEHGVEDLVTDPDDPEYRDPTAAGYQTTFVSSGPMEQLPGGLVFHPSATFSLLIDASQTDLQSGEDTGPDGSARSYTSFKFTPDGRCTLSAARAWTLTIVPEKDAAASAPPPNYAALQLDAPTARARVYRP